MWVFLSYCRKARSNNLDFKTLGAHELVDDGEEHVGQARAEVGREEGLADLRVRRQVPDLFCLANTWSCARRGGSLVGCLLDGKKRAEGTFDEGERTYIIMWMVSLQRSKDEETLRSLSWCRSMISSRRCSGMVAQDGSGIVHVCVMKEGGVGNYSDGQGPKSRCTQSVCRSSITDPSAAAGHCGSPAASPSPRPRGC